MQWCVRRWTSYSAGITMRFILHFGNHCISLLQMFSFFSILHMCLNSYNYSIFTYENESTVKKASCPPSCTQPVESRPGKSDDAIGNWREEELTTRQQVYIEYMKPNISRRTVLLEQGCQTNSGSVKREEIMRPKWREYPYN